MYITKIDSLKKTFESLWYFKSLTSKDVKKRINTFWYLSLKQNKQLGTKKSQFQS